MHAFTIALRSEWAALSSARSVRLSTLAMLGIAGLLLVGSLSGLLSRSDLDDARSLLLALGIPIAAIVMAELPLRDGLTRRTLLLALLGPVPRATLALARSALVIAILGGASAASVAFVALLAGADGLRIGRESAAAFLAVWAYVGVWSAVHLLFKHGLALGLAVFILGDYQLARVPLGLRNVAPSAHVQNVMGVIDVETLGLPIDVIAPHPLVSVAVLLGLGAAGLALAAAVFSRRDLDELC